MLYRPYGIKRGTENLDLEQMRWLRHERHFHSVGRLLKDLAIGTVLLGIGVLAFKAYRSRPDDVSKEVFDWSAVPGVMDEDPDVDDVDIDI